MSLTTQERNKALVLEAFHTLFNKRDYAAAERFWSADYIQHSAHIEPGRDGLFNLIKSAPPTLKYEPGVIVADGDFVIIHGRFSGMGRPANWIAADIVRIEDGVLVEHWDVLQDEATGDGLLDWSASNCESVSEIELGVGPPQVDGLVSYRLHSWPWVGRPTRTVVLPRATKWNVLGQASGCGSPVRVASATAISWMSARM